MAWSEAWAREELTTRRANTSRRQLKLVLMAVPLAILLLLEMFLGLGFALNALGLDSHLEPLGVAICLVLALIGPVAILVTLLLLRRSGETGVNKLILASGVGIAASLPACVLLLVWVGEASII